MAIFAEMVQGVSRVLLAALTLGLIACERDSPKDPFVPRSESTRLKIGTEFDAELCLGDRAMWEEHLDLLEGMFGVSREVTWVYVYEDGGDTSKIAADCGEADTEYEWRGCWRDPTARGTRIVIPHELTHAYVMTVQNNPLPFLNEGLAVRMAGTVLRVEAREVTSEDFLRSDITAEDYPRAGHLVAWIMETYGTDAVMSVFARSAAGMAPTDVSAVLEEVLGVTMDELLTGYASSAKDYYPAMGGAACGQAPTIAWQDGAAKWGADGSCAEGPFFGFDNSQWWQRVTIDVVSPGTYRLDVGHRWASVTRCLSAPADEVELPDLDPMVVGNWTFQGPFDGLGVASEISGDDWANYPLKLDVGLHEVWVERRSHETPGWETSLSLTRL